MKLDQLVTKIISDHSLEELLEATAVAAQRNARFYGRESRTKKLSLQWGHAAMLVSTATNGVHGLELDPPAEDFPVIASHPTFEPAVLPAIPAQSQLPPIFEPDDQTRKELLTNGWIEEVTLPESQELPPPEEPPLPEPAPFTVDNVFVDPMTNSNAAAEALIDDVDPLISN